MLLTTMQNACQIPLKDFYHDAEEKNRIQTNIMQLLSCFELAFVRLMMAVQSTRQYSKNAYLFTTQSLILMLFLYDKFYKREKKKKKIIHMN